MHKDIIRTSFLVPYKKSLEESNLILTKYKPEKLEVKEPNLFKVKDDVGKRTNKHKQNLDRK